MLLAKDDIATKEVLDWQGMHLLHFSGSTCSKKIRIFLDYKDIDWVSHPVNLVKRENNSDWFMGINPRGLVPVLVHDGQVHIESNDILDYLEQLYPEPPLIPAQHAAELTELLQTEDQLHVDLRNLTMRFTAPSKLMQRSKEQLQQYQSAGTGMVGGEPDPHKAEELEYWRTFAANQGITDAQVVESTARFKQELDKLEIRLASASYLLGDAVSLADIAWFINVNRILLAGYPLQRLHPRLWDWRQRLLTIPAFAREAKAPLPQAVIAQALSLRDRLRRKTLVDIAAV
ncbi:MAG: glutathione S-transferase family protein [Halioglobus sp.]|nr:glutathione S-transferase family protein [Halioglobus sp.]